MSALARRDGGDAGTLHYFEGAATPTFRLKKRKRA